MEKQAQRWNEGLLAVVFAETRPAAAKAVPAQDEQAEQVAA